MEKCVSDITYIPTLKGHIYSTLIMDLYDREINGWRISVRLKARQTILTTLQATSYNRLLNKKCEPKDQLLG